MTSNRTLILKSLIEKLPEDLHSTLAQLSGNEDTEDYDYTDLLQRAHRNVSYDSARFERQMSESAEPMTVLLNREPTNWQDQIRKQPRLHNLAAVSRLLNLSWDRRSIDPSESERLGRLALQVLDFVESGSHQAMTSGLIMDLRSRAWGQIGNARRIQSDLRGADQALVKAREYLDKSTQDPLEMAKIGHWTGRLRYDQRRFEEAITLLQSACREYRMIRDQENQAQALISLGCTYREAGKLEDALGAMARAESLLPPHHEIILHIRHNQIYLLIDLGRYVEAEQLLSKSRPLYAHASEPLVRLRLPWVEGRIAKNTDRLSQAEYLFQKVREGFIEHGIALDAALVSLELAEVYVQQGRTEELKELAKEMVAVFRSRNVEREALAALLMLQHVASAERASLHVIRDIAERLRAGSPQALTPLAPQDL